MNLNDLRGDIDRIDAHIMWLLNERMEKALLTRLYKKTVEDKDREGVVLERVRRFSHCLVGPEFSEDLFRRIMAESKKLQENARSSVGFQGEHGAYSEVAARAWNADSAMIPCRDFVDVFDAVQEGVFDFGIVPVENTLGGLIGPVNSIMIDTELRIVAAVDMPISHCLLSLPGTDYRDIRSAYSHSQALAQCRHFLSRNKLDPIPWYDTAGAARMLVEKKIQGAAAIASRFAAELYDLEIIKENIEDAENNRTRFFILARKDLEGTGNKCSAVFFTEDKAGALFKTLEIFAKAGINLTRIESVPNKPGDYAIFIDFQGSDREACVAGAIGEAAKVTRNFKMLGCYTELML